MCGRAVRCSGKRDALAWLKPFVLAGLPGMDHCAGSAELCGVHSFAVHKPQARIKWVGGCTTSLLNLVDESPTTSKEGCGDPQPHAECTVPQSELHIAQLQVLSNLLLTRMLKDGVSFKDAVGLAMTCRALCQVDPNLPQWKDFEHCMAKENDDVRAAWAACYEGRPFRTIFTRSSKLEVEELCSKARSASHHVGAVRLNVRLKDVVRRLGMIYEEAQGAGIKALLKNLSGCSDIVTVILASAVVSSCPRGGSV